MSEQAPSDFDRNRAELLLGKLDKRLRERGIAGSLYIVGGIAMALTVDDARRTRAWATCPWP